MKRKRKPVLVLNVDNGHGFNRLQGEARDWAKKNKIAQSEHCVRVVDGNRFGGEAWIKNKCGDGRMGFSMRRKGQDEVSLEEGLDGQLKKKKRSAITPKSARYTATRKARRIDGSVAGLASQSEIDRAAIDPQVVSAQKKLRRMKKAKWKQLTRREKRERASEIARLESETRGW